MHLFFFVFALASNDIASGDEAAISSPEDMQGVEEIIVYGVRTGILDAIPGAVTNVIFADDYVAENKSIADLLSETEGVSVRRFGAAGDQSEISIRGSSPSQVVVTIDGVRTNSVLTGGLDLSRICLPLLDRIEVTRGAGSTSEGSGAIGGVVNVVTRGADADPETRVAFSGGAFDTFEGSLLHSDKIGEVDYTVGYCGFATKGDFDFARPTERTDGISASFDPDTATRVNNDRVQHGGTLGLGFPLGGGELRLSSYTVYSSGGEPGTDSGNGVTAGQATDARSRDLSNLAQLRWQGASPFGLGGDLEAGFYHRFESTHFRDPIVVFREPIDVGVRLSTVGARLKKTWEWEFLGQTNEFGLQIDGSQDILRSNEQRGRERPRAGGAVTEEIWLFGERLLISGGGRIDWTAGFGVHVLPSFGIVLSPFPWVRVRGHVGRAYRAPNFDELFHPDEGFIRGNSDLSPEDAWNFDVGLEMRIAEAGPISAINIRAGWFRREIDESIIFVLVNPRTIAPINTGSASIEGYEISVSMSVTRFVRLSANHTQADSRRDATGKALPGQASEETSFRIQLGPQDQWKLVGEMQRIGEILVNEGGSRTLPQRTVWNASAAVNLTEWRWLQIDELATELWLFAQLSNIGDTAVRDVVSFPQPGRHLTAGLEIQW